MNAQMLQAARDAAAAGMCREQLENFLKCGILLQPKQLAMSVAARECDKPGGPVSIGVGGSRGGAKSHWMLSQIAADDCQRFPGLKVLWLRKVGKVNIEHLEDLEKSVLRQVPHRPLTKDGVMRFPNDSRIICGHYQTESEINSYIGVEYDTVGIEEATTLSEKMYKDIRSCIRSSKGWRPRDYSTCNPGGVGHGWYKKRFIMPMRNGHQTETRFIPARVTDNKFNNPEYIRVLESYTGWQRKAWLDGDWDITAGQFFSNWNEEKHVLNFFDDKRAVQWFAALDYGRKHYTVVLLGCVTGDGQMIIVDEHAEREKGPEWHTQKVREMLRRHGLLRFSDLHYFVAGGDIFGVESDGSTVAGTYQDLGMPLIITACWNDRPAGWAAISNRLGDDDKPARLLIHRRCALLIEQLPLMQHDEKRPEDVLKVNCDEQSGSGGDDAADCCRYLVVSYKGSPVVTSASALAVGNFSGRSL